MHSHRARLVLNTFLVSGLLVGTIFVAVALLFRYQSVESARDNLEAGINQIFADIASGVPPDLVEAHESYPGVTFSWFGPERRLMGKSGPEQAAPRTGFHEISSGFRTLLSYGRKQNGTSLVAVTDWTKSESDLLKLDFTLAALWLFVQILVGAASWRAAKATFEPLQELMTQAAEFSGSDLSARLHSDDKAEFGAFARQLNLLLERVEATAKREEQFAADAAHELRTPLTTLLAALETASLKDRSGEEYKKVIQSLIPEVERLSRLTDLLLTSTRSQIAPAKTIDIKPLLQMALARWLDRFEEEGVHLNALLDNACSAIQGEEVDCLMDNLLENALRYSKHGQTVTVKLIKDGNTALIIVSDQGPGVPEELVPTLFERLTTGEVSRSKRSGGFGIGLAICKNIVSARKGAISLENSKNGATFRIELPAAD